MCRSTLWRLLQITKSGNRIVVNVGNGGLQFVCPAITESLRDDICGYRLK